MSPLNEHEEKLRQITDDELNEIDEAYESIKNPRSSITTKLRSNGAVSSGEESKFPIPKNMLINRKMHSKLSSYYRQNDERLESDTETEFLSQSLLIAISYP